MPSLPAEWSNAVGRGLGSVRVGGKRGARESALERLEQGREWSGDA